MAINTSAILEKARELKAQLQEQLKSEMTKIFPAFWEQNPDIKSIVWTQYAPYFNDGDPCIFSVREVAFTNIEDINLIQGNPYQIIY